MDRVRFSVHAIIIVGYRITRDRFMIVDALSTAKHSSDPYLKSLWIFAWE